MAGLAPNRTIGPTHRQKALKDDFGSLIVWPDCAGVIHLRPTTGFAACDTALSGLLQPSRARASFLCQERAPVDGLKDFPKHRVHSDYSGTGVDTTQALTPSGLP